MYRVNKNISQKEEYVPKITYNNSVHKTTYLNSRLYASLCVS